MIKIEEIDDVLVASFTNEDKINTMITEPIKEELVGLFTEPNVKLALDLSGIKFIDSSGFSVLLAIRKAAENNFGIFKICNISDDVKELFQVLQLHNVFELFDSKDSCIVSFKK